MHQLLVYAVDVNLVSENIKRNTGAPLAISREVGVQINRENYGSSYMFMSFHQNAYL
jgi:hypothetical protein